MTRSRMVVGFACASALCGALIDARPSAQTPAKVEPIVVTGCVTAGAGDVWTLTNATEPMPDQRPSASAQRGAAPATATPAAPESPAPTAGKNRYRLIGILELGVPEHKGHTVTVKGLLIPGAERKINVTSVKMVSATCETSRVSR